jgi:DNA-binding NarL/FixJ family response regulator
MIKVAIIEDERRYWDILKILLEQDKDIAVVHLSDNCLDLINEFRFKTPDVIIMDINLPGRNGIEAVAELKQQWPDIKIAMFTVHEDDENVFNAVKAGAIGYILKYEAAKIADAVKEVFNGRAFINGYLAGKILNYFHQNSNRPQLQDCNLTEREKEILQLLIKGNSYKEIAAAIFISVETLNSHIKNIYRKLNVHSRSELAARYRNSF